MLIDFRFSLTRENYILNVFQNNYNKGVFITLVKNTGERGFSSYMFAVQLLKVTGGHMGQPCHV